MNRWVPGSNEPVVIIGAGPAGLGSAHELLRLGVRPVVLERLDKVGGIARTEQYRGYRFDLGGHRFYTKSAEVQALWEGILGTEFLLRPRLSRIYYRNRFFRYPLRLLNTLAGLGPLESLRIGLSYLRWRLFPSRREDTFEEWVTNRFGRRLFQTFFKSYTEKVWGISCRTLKAEWAAQRIKDLSLWTAMLSMFGSAARQRIRTLTETFHYPRLGPGMLWETLAERIGADGGEVRTGREVIGIEREGQRITALRIRRVDGGEERIAAAAVISSMPLTRLVQILRPRPPAAVLEAAAALRYRDFLTVCLIVDHPDPFPDNWIYVHDPDVKVGRIQNFKRWSPDLVPDPRRCSLGLEYFCNAGDALWNLPDAELIALGTRELQRIGLADPEQVVDGCVVRVPEAYPVYDSDYREQLARLRAYVETFENLQTIGRNGLHRYNNQDHSMLTGMLAARVVALGERHDLWQVNADREYHEEVRTGPDLEDMVEELLPQVFERLHRAALGLAAGINGALLLGGATLLASVAGGDQVRMLLGLLGQFFPGYRVTAMGSLIGLGYGFATGFALGWSYALIRNASFALYEVLIRRRMERRLLRRLLEMF